MRIGSKNRKYALDLARAFGGAIIFSFPLFMTMEMWLLGFYIDAFRLALFLLLTMPLLVGLSYYAGFENTLSWRDDGLDALSAYAVGFAASAAMLFLMSIIELDQPWHEVIGKITLQAVPASIGAMLARSQLGGDSGSAEQRKDAAPYEGELFLMAAGALFLAFNVAPTEEMILIAYMMSAWQTFALAVASLLLLHTFVYTVGFGGQEEYAGGFFSVLLRFTIAGYAIALLVSLYVLWTFGRTDTVELFVIVQMTVVLGFPAALGAALARLII
ncbi:MAG: TIGR02587 family membrane protein [Gammaproteobacteria bacterium]|nr:TIGR02587 family membrane protein [Gammaproteobacteria bacterium]